ncbi:hypothetical protein HAX54_035439 [Datura stramonium]|uniref:Uncharacterized protein n=1 Tax=Datura stramonium TaxID=4076 RepID=A0ABS8SFC5_DATST|nr:hypothetical protein [Datura stramonium]
MASPMNLYLYLKNDAQGTGASEAIYDIKKHNLQTAKAQILSMTDACIALNLESNNVGVVLMGCCGVVLMAMDETNLRRAFQLPPWDLAHEDEVPVSRLPCRLGERLEVGKDAMPSLIKEFSFQFNILR